MLRNVYGSKEDGSGLPTVMLYTIGAVLVFVLGVTTFSIMDRNTEFAIAVFGSLVGGFLGALLASIIVAKVFLHSDRQDR